MMKKLFKSTLCLSLISVIALADENVAVSGKTDGGRIVVTYNIAPGLHQALEKDLFNFEVKPVDGVSVGEIVYPATAEKQDGIPIYHGKVELSRKISVSKTPDAKILQITASYQVCKDSGMCYMPESIELKVELPDNLTPEPTASAGGEKADVKTASVLKAGETEKKTESSLIHMLLLAFLGGLILNLMPCVLPVLSIKMLSIVNSASQNRREILKGGLIYTAGILVSFAVLAAAVAILKKSGESVGWGFQFQNPYFVFGLLTIIWAFALSLLGVFHIQLPGANLAHKASSSHGMTGTFMSGVFAVLLATPCTAPMLGSAVGFTLKQPTPVIFLMMLTIGFGLAFPFILLSLFPAVIRFIPKPGNWMNVFSNLMGFLLLGTAVFLARTLSFIVSPSQFINVMWFVLILSFGLWLYGLVSRPHIPRKRQWFGTLVCLIMIIAGGYYLLDFSAEAGDQRSSKPSGIGDNWREFSPELVNDLRKNNKVVFVDFSAEWCMTCKANEAMVLNTDDVQKAFKDKGVVLLHGDFTKKDPVILKWLQKYERGGVPLYLLFIPGHADAIVFPELITKPMILKALKNISR